MDLTSSLSELGLHANEIDVYLFLLHNGPCQATQIQAGLEIEKVPTYRALNGLRSKGYVDAIGETRNQRFGAQPIEMLLDEYDDRMKKLSIARLDVEALARDITKQQQGLYKERKITTYDGADGYRLWHDERLRGKVDVIREFGRQTFVEQLFDPEEIETYMRSYIKRRVAKKIAIRTIDDENEVVPDFDRSNTKLLKQTRTVDLPAHVNGFVSVFGTRFGFYTKHSGKYLGVIVDDAMMASMLTFMFDTLWETGLDV